MRITFFIFSAFILLNGCSDMVAPTNEGSNPSGTGFKERTGAEGGTTSAEPTGGDPTGGGTTTGGGTIKDPVKTEEAPAVGQALNVTGGFKDLALKYIFATHRPTYKMSSIDMPATITFTMSEFSTGTKIVKKYECLDCDDTVITCFCAKDANKKDAKCTGGSATLEYDQFSFTFTAKNALIPLQPGQVHQVEDTGYPKKKDYDLKAVTGFTDPNSALNTLEGLSGFYSFVSTDTTKAKVRTTIAGTMKFSTAITSSSKDFEYDLDLTFKKNAALQDNNEDQAIKGKFKGPISAYKEPVAFPTNCALPAKYVKTIYE